LNGSTVTDDRSKIKGSCLIDPHSGCFVLYCTVRSLVQQGNNAAIIITFNDIIERTILYGLHAIRDITKGGEQNNFEGRKFFLDRSYKFYSIAIWQLHITEHHVDRLLFQLRQSRLKRVSFYNRKSLE
jgi:hypothetical protein